MANSNKKAVPNKSLLVSLRKTLAVYQDYKSARAKKSKISGSKVRRIPKKINLTPANKERLKVWAARLGTTKNELINAILWDELLNKPKTA